MLGRLSWAAIPFDQPVVMIASGTVGFVIFCVLALVTVKGWWPYSVARMDHQRRSQAHRRDVHRSWRSSCWCAVSRTPC